MQKMTLVLAFLFLFPALVIAQQNLPPYPGEAGKVTLAGIDSDNDGVRDDVQRFIALKYTESAKMRSWLTMEAKHYQKVFDVYQDKTQSVEHRQNSELIGGCRNYLHRVANVENTFDAYGDTIPEILNTEARSLAYIQYNKNLSGNHFGGRQYEGDWSVFKQDCDFDPDLLPN